MDIRNDLMEIQEKFSNMDAKFRQLWDSLVEDEDGISGDAYYSLVALGEIICPVFTKDASARIVGNDNKFFRERTY